MDALKSSMEKFLPHYVDADLNLPKEYKFDIEFFLDILSWHYKWTNIKYSNINMDIRDVKIQFTNRYDKALLNIDFPAIKLWEISAHQNVNSWILPSDSEVKLIIQDFDLKFDTNLVLDPNGYLDPVVANVDIDFGKTMAYHENQFLAFLTHQFFTFLIVVIKNSIYFLGGTIFSNIIGPMMDTWLNHYQLPIRLRSPFAG
jgi:hypothetical protein